MKKSNKKILMTLTIIAIFFSCILSVNAQSATVGISGNSTVAEGSNITLKMYVSNVSNTAGGVVSVGANLVFDSEYLQYVSGTGATTPYGFSINPSSNYVIAGLDMSLSNGITGTGPTNVFTFVFKALKQGSTEVTLANAKLTDTNQILTTTVVPKTITIGAPAPVLSGDNNLSSLTIQGYTLSPSFTANTTTYNVNVPSSATSVIINAQANHAQATISGTGTINLTGTTTNAIIKVTAQNGSSKNYTVRIHKPAPDTTPTPALSNDATLKSLSVKSYTITPAFNSAVNSYSMGVKNNITKVTVLATTNSDKATYEVTGNTNLKAGNNVINIKVTAEDGTTNTYTINVTKESATPVKTATKSSDNYLKSLTIKSSHVITPKFNRNTSNYSVTVPYEVNKLDLNYITNHTKAKVKTTGNDDFKVNDMNVVELTITAEDGSVRVYTLNVTRSTLVSGNNLKSLTVNNGELIPKFEPEQTNYKVKVNQTVTKLEMKAIPEKEDTNVEIIGNENFRDGNNTVLIKVSDKEGFTKYYTIEVEKEKTTKILGLTPLQFGLIAGITSLLLIYILYLLLSKKDGGDGENTTKDENKKTSEKHETNITYPNIEFRPEFNFGSKNNSDNDVVNSNYNKDKVLKEPTNIKEIGVSPFVKEAEYAEDIPYDPYDDVVTKEEVIDAIHEATKTKDTSKLKMLLDQEELNKRKEEIKRKEEQRNEEKDWR